MKTQKFLAVGLVLGGFLVSASVLSAADPASSSKTKKTTRPKTLGDIAGQIKIDKSESSEGIVIDNANLKELGQGGIVSKGGSLAPSMPMPAPAPSTPGTSAGPAPGGAAVPGQPGQPGVRPQGRKQDSGSPDNVALLEAQLEAIRKAEQANRRANLYNGSGPQYRAPGTPDVIKKQRQQLENELRQAKGQGGGNGQ